MTGPLDVLLGYFDRQIAEAERRATDRAKANDWSEFAYLRRKVSDLQRQRQRLLQLLGTAPLGETPEKILDTLVNSV